MPLSDYDQYINGGYITATGPDVRLGTASNFPTHRAAALVRQSQSGSLRGGILCLLNSTASNNNFYAGVTFMHSQRDITGAGSFYFVGFQNPNFRLYRFLSGATDAVPAPILMGTIPAPANTGTFTVYWDANVSGLGGTRITAYFSGVLAFDVLDIFHPRSYSSGEGLLFIDTAAQSAEMQCATYGQYSLA